MGLSSNAKLDLEITIAQDSPWLKIRQQQEVKLESLRQTLQELVLQLQELGLQHLRVLRVQILRKRLSLFYRKYCYFLQFDLFEEIYGYFLENNAAYRY